MARERKRAGERKREDAEAQLIGQGVYTIAVDLRDRRDLPVPVWAYAPLVYVCEMMASVRCQKEGWTDEKRAEDVARYLMAGVLEFVVALLGDFDVEHFEAWVAAARLQDQRGEVAGG